MDALVRSLTVRVLAALVTGYGLEPLLAKPATPPAALDAFADRAAVQVRLPDALREISGLATAADGRVVAHGDERGVVYVLDPRRGAIVRSFTLGAAPPRADFEGVAIGDGRLFLVTSDGWLYETRASAAREGSVVTYTRRSTGLGALCELEGLAWESAARALVIPCKRPLVDSLRGRVTLFRWSVDRNALVSRVSVRERALARSFSPSSVEVDPATGHYLLVAGPQRLLAEVTPQGAVVAARRLDPRLHRQPEGVTLLGDSALLVADEGGPGHGRATLTTYPRARAR